MAGRKITTIMGDCNKRWLSNVLGIPSQTYGIDLVNDKIGIEVKSRLDFYKGTSYAVHNYQVIDFPKDNKGKELYWAFLLYGLSSSVKEIEHEFNIEQFITDRKVWFFEWNWVKNIKVARPRTGPYRYVSPKRFDNGIIFNSFRKDNGLLYVPVGSSLEGYL